MRILDPGSFRDPTSQVFHDGEHVLRAVRGVGSAGWRALVESGLLTALTDAGLLVRTSEVPLPPALAEEGWEALLEHERVPFVSYPYEWPFAMLKDAALLQLDVLLAALEKGITLKDATPYNVQWIGTKPTFIDVGSFSPLEEGEPWIGYRQFCRQFLFPLLLRSYRNLPFQPWLRGSLDGIAASELRPMLRLRHVLRRSVLLHVVLQARAEAREGGATASAREELQRAGFRRELIQANVSGLRRLVGRLRWEPEHSAWFAYAEDYEHVSRDREAKSRFVERAIAGRRRQLVWDLGANDGHFSRIAAENAETVVAMDADEATLSRLYQALRGEDQPRILPLLVDLADPSPNLGWAGNERRDLPSRGKPDFLLALAVLHHLVITRSVPPDRFVEWIAGLGTELVLEFAEIEDPMVKRLMRNKRRDEVHDSYDLGHVRKLLSDHFEVLREERLPSGHRVLLHARPRQ